MCFGGGGSSSTYTSGVTSSDVGRQQTDEDKRRKLEEAAMAEDSTKLTRISERGSDKLGGTNVVAEPAPLTR